MSSSENKHAQGLCNSLDNELDLIVIAIQALVSHRPCATTHDLPAIDRGREILREALLRWAEVKA